MRLWMCTEISGVIWACYFRYPLFQFCIATLVVALLDRGVNGWDGGGMFNLGLTSNVLPKSRESS